MQLHIHFSPSDCETERFHSGKCVSHAMIETAMHNGGKSHLPWALPIWARDSGGCRTSKWCSSVNYTPQKNYSKKKLKTAVFIEYCDARMSQLRFSAVGTSTSRSIQQILRTSTDTARVGCPDSFPKTQTWFFTFAYAFFSVNTTHNAPNLNINGNERPHELQNCTQYNFLRPT